jgi:2-polyprenyl-6-methoxyphenol hydroxylase-like FAD-dependent oxidoreductase
MAYPSSLTDGWKLSSIVITISSEKAESIMQMDDQDFSQDIASRFNHRFGEMQLEGERHAYPLIAVHANYFHSTRFALIGDASVGCILLRHMVLI